ncbi:hypothetical protein KBK19_19125 [Microvirga sp. STR05]|uniref:Right-handed parallel beta-helix repeat-containing protein n=1 Tax=Hymenobacter duratus TaxID=2771356 RepID=A0ABR8JQT9_9BACT|nr:hypothetical protein [Hymenobacter duratus]MBD2717164.1 hypothetical protein [Hymenobacter duratus]MBR7952080.1 hypothetical protein [Microvirga sp. STR05]
MRFLLPLLLICSALLCLLPGCEPKEDLLTTDASAKLEFSRDTVIFDTVFAQVGTVSKRLWVYNRNNRAVKVDQIRLSDTNPGTYSLIINGDERQAAAGLEIRGNDSLLILVKAKLGPSNLTNRPFLVTEQLLFTTNGNEQDVKLVAYGQNAYFHGPEERISRNTTWPKNRPHVIYGVVVVDAGVTLRIQPGTRIYSHAGAALVVRGTLLINENTTPTTELAPNDTATFVRFQSDRLEPFYAEIPGQWGGIQFDASSRNSVVNFTEIKNAAFGLVIANVRNQLPHPLVTVSNSIFRNISGANLSFNGNGNGAGIIGLSGDFNLTNCLFTNCGEYAILGIGGGAYTLNYCTVANYTPQFQRKTPSLFFTTEPASDEPLVSPITASISIRNSIVWGSIPEELGFENSDQYRSGINVRNSLLRTRDYAGASDAAGKPGLGNQTLSNILNESPRFKRTPETVNDRYDYRLDTLSPASNKAVYNSAIPRDLLFKTRSTTAPDLGAYERVNP